jgi:hypothetical protein
LEVVVVRENRVQVHDGIPTEETLSHDIVCQSIRKELGQIMTDNCSELFEVVKITGTKNSESKTLMEKS